MERGARPGVRPIKYCCLAIGSRDCALSVWCTSDHRPLFAIHDLFTKSVMDLSWSADGYYHNFSFSIKILLFYNNFFY